MFVWFPLLAFFFPLWDGKGICWAVKTPRHWECKLLHNPIYCPSSQFPWVSGQIYSITLLPWHPSWCDPDTRLQKHMCKQQGPPVQHRILYIQYPVIDHSGEEYKKECIGKTESLYCIAEIGTTLQVNYISIKIYLPIFQIITMSSLLWKLILHLFFTPCSLDSCTSWSTERNLLTPPSKTEHAQGWSGIFGMTAIQGSSASIAFTLNLLLMLLFESNIHLSKLVFPMKT